MTPVGVVLALGMAAYIFAGIFLLGVGDYWLGTVLLVPVVVTAAVMAYREWSMSLSRFPRIGKAFGILNAVLVIGVLLYVGVQFYVLSKV